MISPEPRPDKREPPFIVAMEILLAFACGTTAIVAVLALFFT